MAQTFPFIENVDHIRAAIEGRSEFSIMDENGRFIVVDYHLTGADTFTDGNAETLAIRRECRGLIFYKDGTIARRAFHKFFNVGEHEESMAHQLDLSGNHHVLTKLDGSMVAPFLMENADEVYWASMRGSYPYHLRLRALYDGTRHEELVRAALHKGLTPIFEFCAPDNRIVVPYEAPSLTLLALRNTVSGAYLPQDDVIDWGAEHNVPVVEPFAANAGSIAELIDEVRALEDAEGAVLVFASGLRAKLKGDWYAQVHKTLSYFGQEKDIAKLILSGHQDDLVAILDETRREQLLRYQADLHGELARLLAEVETWRQKIAEAGMSRKDFAMLNAGGPVPVVKALVFRGFDQPEKCDYHDESIGHMMKTLGSDPKWTGFKTANRLSLTWDGRGIG